MPTSPIFIVGPHRAGSTVWHNLVSMCPGILRLGEPWFIGPRRYKDFRYFLKSQTGSLSSDQQLRKLVQISLSRSEAPGLQHKFWRFDTMSDEQLSNLESPIYKRLQQSDRSLKSFVHAYLDEVLLQSGERRICMKFPVDVANVPDLIDWYPDCKIMHLTRDPRGLAMSKTNDPSGTALRTLQHPNLAWAIRKSAVCFVTREYGRLSRLHKRFQNLPNYRLFRYEDLLADPEHNARQLCHFIGEPYTPDILDLEKGRHEHQPSSLTGNKKKTLDPSAALHWQSNISPFDLWFINNFAKQSMRRFGYNPESHPIYSIKSTKPTEDPAQFSI